MCCTGLFLSGALCIFAEEGCRSQGGHGLYGGHALQLLTDQLTLSQLGGGSLCVEMGFYANISWKARCSIDINICAHFLKIGTHMSYNGHLITNQLGGSVRTIAFVP